MRQRAPSTKRDRCSKATKSRGSTKRNSKPSKSSSPSERKKYRQASGEVLCINAYRASLSAAASLLQDARACGQSKDAETPPHLGRRQIQARSLRLPHRSAGATVRLNRLSRRCERTDKR